MKSAREIAEEIIKDYEVSYRGIRVTTDFKVRIEQALTAQYERGKEEILNRPPNETYHEGYRHGEKEGYERGLKEDWEKKCSHAADLCDKKAERGLWKSQNGRTPR
jgi:flagellar biosynthesis/type III secretory pathway protein FliH